MKTRISVASELMKNNKQANIMSAEKKFEVLQTEEGHALFFSISNDGVFYLTREVPGDKTGWVKTDLSYILSQYNNGVKVEARTFMVSQNQSNNNIDLVLAVKGQDQDYLYVAQNIDNADKTWGEPLSWDVMGYDDATHAVSKVVISDVYIAQAHTGEHIVVDILQNPDDGNHFIYRYYIDPSKKSTGKVWNVHALAANLNSATVQSCLGRKSDQLVDGIYTLGEINSKKELIYTPLYNPFNAALPANPSRLAIPQSAAAMTVAQNNQGNTGLFVAGDESLYYFPYDKQEDGDAGQVILQHELLLNVTQLYARTSDTEMVVWGLNQQGQIFYTKCARGNELHEKAWSIPVPILTNVQQVTTYLNKTTSSNVVFAHIDGTNLVQLVQDPETSIWHNRSIILPSTDIDDVLEFDTYTTHVQLLREDNIPVGGLAVAISSTSRVSVYLNNRFTILTPDVPVNITTDDTGVITILQETKTIGAVCYGMKLGDSTDTVDVNPMLKLINTMAEIKTGDDLSKVTVTNEDGSTKPLVPSSVSVKDNDAVAQAMQQFVQVSNSLPQDGTVKEKPQTATMLSAKGFVPSVQAVWGLSFDEGGVTYHHGDAAMQNLGIGIAATTNTFSYQSSAVQLQDISDAIESTAGDIFNWLKGAWDSVSNFFIKLVDDVYHFFVEIGGKLYRFVLNCMSAVVTGIEFVVNKIKVFFADLIEWLGFLFQWKDILLTHSVLKNLFRRYLENSIDQVDVFKAGVGEAFKDVEKRINDWAGLQNVQGNLSEKSASAGTCPGKDDPQSNYGIYHMNHGAGDASTNANIVTGIANDLEQLLNTLSASIEKEGDIFQKAFDTIQTQVIGQIDTLSFGDIVKRILAVLADILVESVDNIIETSLDVIKILMKGVLDILDGRLDIPVLSWLYKKITGNELSLLDAICLVLAIPTTLIYKLTLNKAPFPDNATTQNLINASNWAELRAIFQPQRLNQFNMKNSMMAATASTSSKRNITALEDDPEVTKFILALRLVAGFSSFLFIYLSGKKADENTSRAISAMHGICFYTTTAPNLAAGLITDDTQRWDRVLNEVIYGITAIEKLVDVFTYQQETNMRMETWVGLTKWIDLVLGVGGLVPTIAAVAYKQDAETITGAIADTCWNVNRIMTPFADRNIEPPVYAVKMGMIVLYGIGQFVLFSETLLIKDVQTTAAAEVPV